MTSVLGVKLGPQHDTGACVVREHKGTLVCTAIAEERLDREKHSRSFPELSIACCLEQQGLRLSDLDLIVIDTLTPLHLRGDVNDAAQALHQDDAPASQAFIRTALNICPTVILNHHLAHAASAFHVSGLERAAILIVDGSGSAWPIDDGPERNVVLGKPGRDPEYRLRLATNRRRETQSVFAGSGRSLARVAVSHRSGVGHFYTWASERVVGFNRHQEGKLMGLAGWGELVDRSVYPQPVADMFQGINTPILERLIEIGFNPPLRREVQPPTHSYYAGLAHWADCLLRMAVRHLATFAIAQCEVSHLCMAGGVALNVVANRAVRDDLHDRGSLFIQPAASDMGIPLGCALYGYYNMLGGRLPFQNELAYLGPHYDDQTVRNFMSEHNATQYDDENRLLARVADYLAANRIVGWYQGASEYGPRALGNRSILCSPRHPGMKDHLNASVKHREAFRPFAPLCRMELAKKYFDVDYPVPYMLINTMVKPPYRHQLPAIIHIDGSARLQTISREQNPRLYRLLLAFEQADEFGVLLNTSFNDAGEPIVETVEDAWNCFTRTGIDVLVCGQSVAAKEEARMTALPVWTARARESAQIAVGVT